MLSFRYPIPIPPTDEERYTNLGPLPNHGSHIKMLRVHKLPRKCNFMLSVIGLKTFLVMVKQVVYT